MSRKAAVEIIKPPNKLKRKVGGSLRGIDKAAIKRAEAALANMQDEFDAWLLDDLNLLIEAKNRLHSEGISEDALNAVRIKAHDLKGLGVTYNYPLVTRVAASLNYFLEYFQPAQSIPVSIINSHVEAIRAIVHNKVQAEDDPTGTTLASELEKIVAEALPKAQ